MSSYTAHFAAAEHALENSISTFFNGADAAPFMSGCVIVSTTYAITKFCITHDLLNNGQRVAPDARQHLETLYGLDAAVIQPLTTDTDILDYALRHALEILQNNQPKADYSDAQIQAFNARKQTSCAFLNMLMFDDNTELVRDLYAYCETRYTTRHAPPPVD